jgi:hypothetical protein
MENTLGNVRLEVNCKIIQISYLKIRAEPNSHGTAELTGLLDETGVSDVMTMKMDVLKIKENDRLLFSGVIDKVTVKHIHGVFYIMIKAFTQSVKLDIKKRRRSFQNKKSPYAKIFETVVKKGYGGDFIDSLTAGEPQGKFILQYDETDWEFLIRVSSQFGGVVIPDSLGDKPRVYIGAPNPESAFDEEYNYGVENDIIQNNVTKLNYDEKTARDHITARIKSDAYYEIGTNINYRGEKLVVSEIEFVANNGVIEKKYRLGTRSGIYANYMTNESFTGLSIEGTVLAVREDRMKLHLAIDESQPVNDANWFKFSSFYTSEGQTGFYFMPRAGDGARLYLPEANEDKAFVNFVNRTDGSSNGKTSDADIKYLGNNYGKEIKLAPKEFKITSVNGGIMQIKMTDDGGMEITCNRPVKIRSEEDISFKGEKIKMTAKESVCALVNGGGATLKGVTHFKGSVIEIKGAAAVLPDALADALEFVFDPNPGFSVDGWNADEYKENTNCYAYAFNMLVNPLTQEKFPINGMQPGMLSGQFDAEKISTDAQAYYSYMEIMSGTAEGNKKLVSMITADANAVGLDFLSYDESLTGGYAVALAVRPDMPDYHWYRDNGDGTWSHKPGRTLATDREFLGYDGTGAIKYGEKITDPKDAASKSGYSEFVGYYYIRPTSN